MDEIALGILRARLENDHEMVVYYMNQLKSQELLWSAKHIFEDLANTAENVYRGDL